MDRRIFIAGAGCALAAAALAQEADGGQGTLNLSASLGAGAPLPAGLRWRVFKAVADPDGLHRLMVESAQARPSLTVPAGDYVVHVAFGLASGEKSVTVGAEALNVKLALSAGALRIHCTAAGDKPVEPANVSLAIYVPERNNATAKLVYAKARAGEVIGVPEGNYHIASTYLNSVGVGTLGQKGPGEAIPSNSISAGDVNVATGKIVDVTLRHRVAKLTIKLVNAPGGGALANSTFTVLTPGGDIVRELAGAFPSLVLAEGEYVVVARHNAKTYQATFTVQSGMDRDVEVLAEGRDQLGAVMQTFFVQIKCSLGKTYQVANALAEAEIASEIYSIAGEFDILAKFYVEQNVDIGHFVGEKVHSIAGIADTRTLITFRAF